MFFLFLIHSISDAHACINSMLGHKRIFSKQLQGSEKQAQALKKHLGFIYECMLQYAPKELLDQTERSELAFSITAQKSITNLQISSHKHKRNQEDVVSCISDELARTQFPYEEGNNQFRADIKTNYHSTDRNTLEIMLPQNLNGEYWIPKLPHTTLTAKKRNRQDIKYTLSHHNPATSCSFSYTGLATIQGKLVALDMEDCTNTLHFEKGKILVTIDELCELFPPKDTSCSTFQHQELLFSKKTK